MQKIIIQKGDSARIAIVLPADKMADVQDVICYVGRLLVFKQSDDTLTATDDPNIFHLDLKSDQTNTLSGETELAIAVNFSDFGVKKTPNRSNLVIQVDKNVNDFHNDSVSDLVLATVSVTINETTISASSCLASYVVIGGSGAVNSVNGQTGVVVLDADDIAETATRFWLTSTLKNAYDGAVTWISTNGANLLNHLSNTSNPHNVTKNQVGLSNVANSDTTTTENITDSLDKRFATDANLVVIGNTSGTNTGDETTASIQTKRPLKTINGKSLEGIGDINQSFIKYKNTTPSALFSGTTEQVLIVIPIASIGFTIGSWFILKNRLERPIKVGNNCILKYYTHNSESWSIGQGTQIATFNASTNQGHIPFKREFSVQSDNTLFGYQNNIAMISDDGLTSGVSSTSFSGKTYIIVTVSQTIPTDTIRSREVIIMGEV